MQISTKQSSVSLIKKKGGAYKGQFSRLNLAVYPFKVEFLANTQYQTFFLFQKNYQIIGEIKGMIPMHEKGSKYQLRNAMNLIYFKLFQSTNIIYKWSVYKKYRNGQEEYLESCSLDLKEAVNNFIIPQKNIGQSTIKSSLQFGFNATQIRLKFPKTGLILMFILFVSEDVRQIKEYVQEKMLKKDENLVLQNIPLLAPSQSENNSAILGVSIKMNQNSANSLQDIQKKESNQRINNQDLLLQSKQKQIIKQETDNSKKVSGLHDHIDNIIMRFDSKTGEIGQLRYQTNGSKLIQFQIEVTQQQKDERKQIQKNESNGNIKNKEQREFAILKLQSDEGRVNQAQIDQKLETHQLEAIQEERTSKAGIFRSRDLATSGQKRFEKLKQTTSEVIVESSVVQNRLNLRKVGIYIVVSIFLFLIAANLKNLHKKSKRNRK